MDTVERDKDESQTEDLRRPSTPLRPVSPLQPISQINQVNESDQWTPETFYSVPIQWSAQSLAGFTDGGKSIFTDDLEMTSAAGIAGSDISISRDLTTNQAISRPLTDLLAISCANSLSKLAGRPFGTSNQSETHRRESKRHRQLFDIDIKSTASVQGLGSTTTQQIHHGHGLTASCCYYDLNMPPQATEDANFHNENSLFAPFTPEKTIRSEKKKTDTEHLAASSNTNIKKKGNDDTGTMSIATELECNGNDVSGTISIASELECDGAPQGDKSSPFRTSSAPSKDTDKETFDGIDLNKTPGKKERRKKHRPKVINEGKSRTQKMPNPTTSKESTKPKRNRVQKKGLDKATPAKVSPGSTVQNMMEGTNSSCKKVLDFDNEGELIENGATPKEPTSLPERLTTPTMNTCPPKEILADSQEGGRNIKAQVGVDAGTGLWTAADWIEAEQAKRSKRCVTEHASGGINLDDTHRKSTILCGTSARLVPFPDIHKKRRTEKVQYPTTARPSSPTDIISIVELGTTSSQNASKKKLRDASNCKSAQHQFGSSLEEPNRSQTYTAQSRQEIMNASHTKKRRSTAQFQNNFPLPTDYVRQNIDDLQRHNSCVEALAAEKATFIRKRRTKITSVVHSSYLKTQESPAQMFSYDPSGSPEYIWSDMLIKQFQHMDINREVEQMEQPQDVVISYRQNELVLYKREGAMVSYDGSFDPIKKRPPRPKVELDEETIRVWKLLLEDINSEGINGTNEENTKKWEEEREVFRGRANSFIARMRLVQGDRRFSPWKGSVVDSVVGVFLTQNVSDHLSSSAFMALAARFPRKSEEATSIVTDETDLSILDSEKFMNYKERTSNKPNCDWRNIKVTNVEEDEENKAVNSSGSSRSITGERKAADDTASSENSVDTTKPQTRKDIGLCSKNSQPIDATSRLNSRINSCTSFMELLQMQEIPLQRQGFTMPYDVYSHESTNLLPKISNAVPNQSQGSKTHRHGDKISNLSECISGKNMDHLGNYQLLLNTNQGYVSQHPDVTSKENKVSATFIKKNEDPNFMYEEHAAKVVSSAYSAAPDILLKTSVHEAPEFSVGPPGKGTIFWSESLYGDSTRFSAEFPSCKQGDSLQQHENLSYSSCNMGDITEITSTLGNSSSREQNTAEPNINMHASKITSGDTESLRSKQEASNNINAFDWDSLRKDVESNVKRRRTDSTMDSLDWEAVRIAEIHEIAETIKERGMNYKLAERIRAFLNRLVDDHGSIDLEWLRDVPPDKAKEYLLSIRGLGLKSVECVRLLTLHHLAFPVDTNVGRIAVRLGWVPLQPLPELLQIHLLELYPMLNSIQKYLWPRLCKLDQKTLYELHYQLITFGKVFCTKTKPNCNACPMRGECRHFASAFASARLALPAPEERRIVNVTENGASQQNTAAMNHIPLPLPPGSEQPREIRRLEEISRPSSIEPIIEMPGTPEPEPEDGQTLETDIEDLIKTNKNNIPTINVDIEEFKQNLQSYVQLTEQQGGELSKALVALTPEAASIPTPKLKNVSRLRTEHQVYELPDSHPLLSHLDKREPDDPCSYLLSIWKPGETPDCTEPPQNTCNSQGPDNLCDDIKCFSCNSMRESISQTVRGTILVPCRTAMRGSFPLNGTYFQVNEVFADHESSYNPIIVPRDWLWNLPRCTVYFGTSVSSIFKGLDTGDIQHCFWQGYVCVRGFEQRTRAPRPLGLRFHCSLNQQKRKEKLDDKGQPPGSNAKPSGGQFQQISSAAYEGQILVN